MSETEVVVAESSLEFLHQRKAGKREIEETTNFPPIRECSALSEFMGLFYIKRQCKAKTEKRQASMCWESEF